MTTSRIALVLIVGLACQAASQAATVRPDEITEARQWATAKFRGELTTRPYEPGLVVEANHDPVQRNARNGRPMRIGSSQYARGLYCHAFSRVIVRLPSPGAEFNAIVGVDTNDQTSGGRGSVVFAVQVVGKEAFRSGLMREGTASVAVDVDLGGATEFVLQVDDGGDGISCDQADWADAKVTLADGKTVWLGELPLLDAARKPPTTEPPFSFTYAGRPSSELLATWRSERKAAKLDESRTGLSLRYTDPDTGLVVRCEAIEYTDFPTAEWTLYFKNTGTSDTPILEQIQAMDVRLERPKECEFVLHHNRGDSCTINSFEPLQTLMGPGAELRFAPDGGRPTNGQWPYYSIQWGDQGLIVVIGWPGQWASQFSRDRETGLRVRAGQEQTRLKLHPGEEIRTPLVVVQFWSGDKVRAQNVWRRWMRAHGMPRPGGQPVRAQTAACSSHQFGEMINANEENQKFFVDRYVEERLPLDYWWMDAGWYPNDPRYNAAGWPNTGTWEVDRKRFPNGLRAVSDHARSKGIKTIVWFEPERVTPGTWLWRNHQDWLLGPPADPNQDVADRSKPGDKLLNLGNDAAREWLTNHVDKLLTEQGIDLYRQDFNTDPLGRWRANDAPDRQGITEIRYVTGYLAYWDELRRRHPNMLIDSCASGGRRNDLETMRRAVPLLRSDYILEPVGQQNHAYGLSFWLPFYGTGMTREGLYDSRSCFCPHLICCYDMRDRQYDFERARRVIGEWKQIAGHMLDGDYYPLTPYNPANDAWMAWQFNLPEKGEGAVQAFRRAESIYRTAEPRLRGLDPESRYVVTNLDSGATTTIAGRVLMDEGLRVEIPSRPGAAIIRYAVTK